MARADALRLDESLLVGDVTRAWTIWSEATEAALADAYRFAGGPGLARVWFWSEVVYGFV